MLPSGDPGAPRGLRRVPRGPLGSLNPIPCGADSAPASFSLPASKPLEIASRIFRTFLTIRFYELCVNSKIIAPSGSVPDSWFWELFSRSRRFKLILGICLLLTCSNEPGCNECTSIAICNLKASNEHILNRGVHRYTKWEAIFTGADWRRPRSCRPGSAYAQYPI